MAITLVGEGFGWANRCSPCGEPSFGWRRWTVCEAAREIRADCPHAAFFCWIYRYRLAKAGPGSQRGLAAPCSPCVSRAAGPHPNPLPGGEGTRFGI